MGAIGGKATDGIGKSRGGWNTKIHAVVDALGFPIEIKITEGQVHDSIPAVELMKDHTCENVIADKAYDTNSFREAIEASGKHAVIPAGGNRVGIIDYDRHTYKERHLVECFFQKIKKWGRIATRYEKALDMFEGMVHLSCILVWLMF